jgi:hypothetical protein
VQKDHVSVTTSDQAIIESIVAKIEDDYYRRYLDVLD